MVAQLEVVPSTPTPHVPLTAGDLLNRLESRFQTGGNNVAPSRHLFATEVIVPRPITDRFGYGTRRIDAVAVGLWRSTGYAIHGFELKVSRNDWRQEMREPEKAATGRRFCDFWWLVVSDGFIVRRGELPSDWGLLVPYGQFLRAVVDPVQNPAVDRSPAFVAGVLGAMLRRTPAGFPIEDPEAL